MAVSIICSDHGDWLLASGQRLCRWRRAGDGPNSDRQKSNEKTAIPALLHTLALENCIVTIDAMGTQANIAQAIRDKKADYVLAVKTTIPRSPIQCGTSLHSSRPRQQNARRTAFYEQIEKDHGRIEHRRCYVFDQLDCLQPQAMARFEGLRRD